MRKLPGLLTAVLTAMPMPLPLRRVAWPRRALNVRILAVALWIVVIAMSTGCRQRDFCYVHADHAPRCQADIVADYQLLWEIPYEGLTDWRGNFPDSLGMTYEGLLPQQPKGLRVLDYYAGLEIDGELTGSDGISETNLPPFGGRLWLSEGQHSLLFHNNDTEYIKFENLGSFANAIATTRSRTRVTYRGNTCYRVPEGRGELTVAPPDMLFGTYMPDYQAVRQPQVPTLRVILWPLVFTYVIDYEVTEGLERVTVARGALAGMARGVRLDSGHTTADAATVLYECRKTPTRIVAAVKTFGVPDFPRSDYVTRADEGLYAVNLEVMCRNGRMYSFDFDVTPQVRKQPQGGVIFIRDIKIPEEEGSGGSAFDVDVEGWGEYEDVELKF